MIAVGVGIVVAYGLYVRPKSAQPAQLSGPPDPNIFMPEMAAKAVTFAADRGVVLDYSDASVKAVDVILGQLHADRIAGTLSDQEVNSEALHFGGYIGEILRRKYGGTWATDHSVGGPSSFPFNWNGGDSFPVGWCGKRILNGDEDNVWIKYQVVTSEEYQSGGMMNSTGRSPATKHSLPTTNPKL